MNPQLIYFPCFAKLILTFVIAIRMLIVRVAAIKSKQVEMKHFKTYDYGPTPPSIMTQAGRNFSNLFEVPTLFYMVCGFALMTNQVDMMMLVLAWLYVVLRCIHSFIHVTQNKISPRMMIYSISWVVLLIMSSLLAVRILLGS